MEAARKVLTPAVARGKVIKVVRLKRLPDVTTAKDAVPGDEPARAFIGLSRHRIAVVYPNPAGRVVVFDLKKRRVISDTRMRRCR